MTVTVRYTCPHCGTVASVERRAELADRSVTTVPQPGWDYASPDEAFESADGIAFLCGEDGQRSEDADEGADADEEREGCGRPFYLNFVRFERGVELEPDPPTYGGPRFDFLERE